MEVESKLVLCPNGHYYNGALHDHCPLCNSGAGQAPNANFNNNFSATMPVGNGVMGQTMPVGHNSVGNTMPVTQPVNIPGYTPANQGGTGNFPQTAPAGLRIYDDKGKETSGPSGEGITPRRTDPVVGWMVCIDGASLGRSFEMYSGYNYIGRAEGDIVISDDQQISRSGHAMIAYEPRSNRYYVGPDKGKNIILVNGEAIFGATQIKNYDTITLGATTMMFVGLCGEHFHWDRRGEHV